MIVEWFDGVVMERDDRPPISPCDDCPDPGMCMAEGECIAPAMGCEVIGGCE